MTERYTLDELMTVEAAAQHLGIKIRTAQHRVHMRGLGRLFGNGNRSLRLLTPGDLPELARNMTGAEGRELQKQRREAP